jgi:hypothetical protein
LYYLVSFRYNTVKVLWKKKRVFLVILGTVSSGTDSMYEFCHRACISGQTFYASCCNAMVPISDWRAAVASR